MPNIDLQQDCLSKRDELLLLFGISDKETQITFSEAVAPEVFCKKGVLKRFAKLTGKLCQILVY